MRTAVDTNVLFDLIAGEPSAADAAEQALFDALRGGPAVICPVTYAELAAGLPTAADTDNLLAELSIRVQPFSEAALAEAAGAWKHYASRRGSEVQCPRCGHRAALRCPQCQSALVWRQHVIADFLIGAHALRQADLLLTRDIGYYRTYFPTLRLLIPASP